jgi:tetratricopeptide (TPR) repeat protein
MLPGGVLAGLLIITFTMVGGQVPEPVEEQAQEAKQDMLAHRYDEAANLYKQLAEALPNEPGLRFDLALALYSGSHYQDAVRQLKAIRIAERQNAKFWFVLGLSYLKLKQPREAIEPLRHAVELEPGNTDVRRELAEVLWTSRDFEEAIPILQDLVKTSPENADWQFELGDALCATGRQEEGFPHLQRAVEIDPDLLPAQAKLGEALLHGGEAAAAIPHLELAESLDRDGSIHFQLATAYRRVGKADLASRALARWRELQTTDSRK